MVDQPQRAADLLKRETERWRVSLFGERLHVITDEDPESGMRTTAEELESNGIHVRQARVGQFSMEDVFISVVEKARLEGKVASED
jgi:ABC-2 type transport system ATP-binding protein